jgi:kinesin family protein 4/21/27
VEIYNTLILPLLNSCLEGYNATTLAYGQTGAGKTYTTLGPVTSPDFFKQSSSKDAKHAPEYDVVGILPRALRDLFIELQRKSDSLNKHGDENPADGDENNDSDNRDDSGEELGNIQATKSSSPRNASDGSQQNRPFDYAVKLQFLELYGEEIRDLLTTSSKHHKITIRDKAGDAEVIGATEVSVSNAQEAMVCLTRGMLRRVTGATAMNAESSRSHAIMSVIIEQVTRSSSELEGDAVTLQTSKFNFVDLAGSERQKRTNAKGQRMKEGININKGLLVLGNVISALALGDKNKFVPFRDSKLTRILRGSLGGNHKTLMIACASPSHKNAEESLNCLRYANRAKNIQNKAVVNIDPHSKLVNALRGQVEALAGELLRLSNRGGGKVDNERFTLEMLQILVKGGKEAQAITIGGKEKSPTIASEPTPSSDTSKRPSVDDLAAELERTRLELKETKQDLSEKSEQLEAVVAERDRTSTQPDSLRVVPTPSKAKGLTRDESIQEILTSLSTHGDSMPEENGVQSSVVEEGTSKDEQLQSAYAQIEELHSEVDTLRASLDQSSKALKSKTEDLEVAVDEYESVRDILYNTPDIDDQTIHFIVQQVIAFGGYDIDETEEVESVVSSSSSAEEDDEEEDEGRKEKNERLSTFASAMFSTGKFLVDREQFQESITCFETVLEVRREVYGWDDPLVGDALHMEGFVRSKMGDYDRALMLLWDALRIRKIASEPLKISATLRLLADLHFSKEENMHAALFYEECARHLKEHDMKDPHLPLVLIDLARTKDRLGDYGESMNFFEEALSIYEHSLDYDDDRIASLQYEMGVLAFQMGDRDRGEECFRQFIRIRKSKGSNMDEGVANALFVLGSLHWATKKKDLAHESWVEALEIFENLGRTAEDPYVKSLKEKIRRAERRPIGRLFRG